MSSRLYVGNLSYDTDTETLRQGFATVGEVTDAHVVTDRESGRSRGFGFVTMATPDLAKKAIETMNGALIDGFFRHWDEKGRRRVVVTAKAGDTLESIGKQHGVTTNLMERINRRGRSEPLSPGDRVVVWAPGNGVATNPNVQAALSHPSAASMPEPSLTPPLGAPPSPELLPPLP